MFILSSSLRSPRSSSSSSGSSLLLLLSIPEKITSSSSSGQSHPWSPASSVSWSSSATSSPSSVSRSTRVSGCTQQESSQCSLLFWDVSRLETETSSTTWSWYREYNILISYKFLKNIFVGYFSWSSSPFCLSCTGNTCRLFMCWSRKMLRRKRHCLNL